MNQRTFAQARATGGSCKRKARAMPAGTKDSRVTTFRLLAVLCPKKNLAFLWGFLDEDSTAENSLVALSGDLKRKRDSLNLTDPLPCCNEF